jgi:hypothetical protein
MRNTLAVSAVFVVGVAVSAQEPIPPALQAMVDAERAFAEAATQKGIRDSFLEYFAADAVAFNPAPISAPRCRATLVTAMGPS